jgi:hypothetical protein
MADKTKGKIADISMDVNGMGTTYAKRFASWRANVYIINHDTR